MIYCVEHGILGAAGRATLREIRSGIAKFEPGGMQGRSSGLDAGYFGRALNFS